ncbi:MAG: hypothetical protein U9N53_15875 [Bacteroidota bacterium]|nr:hypothetical protein [Bacteroidota bacterium]
MELFSRVRSSVTGLVVKRLLKSRKRNKKVYNLSTARTIGLIFDGTNPKNFDGVYDFYKTLKERNINISILGYVQPKNIPDNFLIKKNIQFFTTKEVNWYFKPKNTEALKFADKKFDILINLDLNQEKVINYIVSISLARFKVGRFVKENNYNDLSIRLDKEPTLEYYIQQVWHYLELINRPDLRPKFENV